MCGRKIVHLYPFKTSTIHISYLTKAVENDISKMNLIVWNIVRQVEMKIEL